MAKEKFHLEYRPDIDGLRAVAVLLVLGFHAFPDHLAGGYIGVDIFFIISGFLITSIIIKQITKNSFRIRDFYARRIIRIFPALIVILLFCWVFGWFTLWPVEYVRLSEHMLAGISFSSNLLLWIQGGYFDLESISKPLLHLWSLGIEEQFYIFYPLLLIIAWRKSYNYFRILIFLLIASLLLNVWLSGRNEIILKYKSITFIVNNTFYSPFTRFWELLMGGCLALNFHNPNNSINISFLQKRLLFFNNMISFFGLILIFCFLIYSLNNNSETQVGAWMLLPTVGAFLLIAAGQKAWVNKRILSSPVFVWFGKISYPLYLWHWPLLSFIHITDSRNDSWIIRSGMVILSIILAWVTYKFIELPVRKIKNTSVKVILLCTSMLFVGGLAISTVIKKGFPGRTKRISELSAMIENAHNPIDTASLKNCKDCPDIPNCNQIDKVAPPTVALVGDSHAQHLFVGLREHYKNSEENLVQFEACTPLNANLLEKNKIFDCSSTTDSVLRYISKSTTIHTVILSWYGQMMFDGGRYKQKVYRSIRLKDNPAITDNRIAYITALRGTIECLSKSNKRIILVLDNPDLGFNPLNDLRPVSFFYTEGSKKGVLPNDEYKKYTAPYLLSIKNMLKEFPQVLVFEPANYLCDSRYCYGIKDGILLYFDPDHLTRDGSMLLGKNFPY